jgi:7-carboxy-7-deazaguanine synthase
MGVDEILHRVASFECPLVEVTGGEPLLQDDTPFLITSLLDKGLIVLLETNGSMDIDRADERCIRIVDIKCPSSGEQESFLSDNLGRLTDMDELKFVIGNRQDYEFARKILGSIQRGRPSPVRVNISNVFPGMDAGTLAEWILEDHLDVRLNVQLHKVIWGTEKRGV